MPDGSLRPQSGITRAEIAKMLYDITGGIINKAGTMSKDTKTNVIVNTSGIELKDIFIDSIIISNSKLESVMIDHQQGLIKLVFDNT